MRVSSNPTNSTTRAPSPSPFSSVIQQLSRSNTFATLIQSLNNNNSSSRSDGLDEIFNARILQHAATTSRPTSRAGTLSLHRRSSARDHRAMKRKWRNTHGTSGEFALGFEIVYCDGGNYRYVAVNIQTIETSRECNACKNTRLTFVNEGFEFTYRFATHPAYNVDNILKNDTAVYCSKKSNNVNIILRFSDPILGVMDPAFVLSKVIVKAPTHGFTAPCKEGLVFVSHDPISIEATLKYDDFTEADYRALYESGNVDDSWPAAFFRLDSRTNMTTQILQPNRSGKYILVKLLRAEGDADNIDLQYLGLIGFTGPRSFDAGSLR
ncbi:8380_t:CDS:2 [Rhizophagus irregularis]|nr:8380_t:CDS:2 [Rhizophagus irregularis]